MNDNKKNDIVNNSNNKNFELSKSNSPQGVSKQSKRNNISDEKLYEIFIDLKNKMSSYDILNSKFDRLEDAHKHLNTELSEVKKSIYDHDEGLYARVKNLENKKLVELKELEMKIVSIQQNLQNSLSDYEECHLDFKNSKEKYDKNNQDFELRLSEINSWKSNVDAMLKWIIITFASGVFGFIGKMILDMI
jgi:chromosome segregation ATPase